MAALQSITVVQNLPRFTGNKKPTDINYTPGTDVRTFFRTMENHFLQHGVTRDDQKVQIVSAHISKDCGDAISLMNCYAGRQISYNTLRTQFLKMYPCFATTNFKHSAKTILSDDINHPTLFQGMTRLEVQSRATIEAYLQQPDVAEKISQTTKLAVRVHNVPIAPPPPPAENGENLAHQGQPLVEQIIEGELLYDVLQHFVMHLLMASQLNDKVFDKLNKCGPGTLSTDIMATVVHEDAKLCLLEKDKKIKTIPARNEYNQDAIFQINNEPEHVLYTTKERKVNGNMGQSGQSTAQIRPTINQNNYKPNNGRKEKTPYCFRCGSKVHWTKYCNVPTYCTFCQINGHNTQVCRKRLEHVKGLYCQNCQLSESHSTENCNRPPVLAQQNKNNQVKHINEQPIDWEEPDEDISIDDNNADIIWVQETPEHGYWSQRTTGSNGNTEADQHQQ